MNLADIYRHHFIYNEKLVRISDGVFKMKYVPIEGTTTVDGSTQFSVSRKGNLLVNAVECVASYEYLKND